MNKLLIKISVILVTFLAIIGGFNHMRAAEDKNLVSIVTASEKYFFNTSWDSQNHYNYSMGAAISESYSNSTLAYIYGQRKVDENGSGQSNGWMKQWVDWECPVDNESGEINITYEYCAYAFLGSNCSDSAYAKLVLTFFIDDEQHEVIIYNNTVNGSNSTDEFSMDSIEEWSKNLTLTNKTYKIGVNASYEIEFTGNATESIAWLSVRMSDTTSEEGDGDTEYWAVLVGVDYKSYNSGPFDRLIPFDEYVEEMYHTLIASGLWQNDHITVLTNENATAAKITMALLWLDLMDDGDDISLVYYGAHGGNLSAVFGHDIDLPPEDEEDGCDEILTTYKFGINHFACITDDWLTFLINNLDSEGIAVIIDSCQSGGMVDSNYSATWITEFSGEMNQNGRVVITCCEEHELGYVGVEYSFSRYMIIGFQGYADDAIEGGDDNGIVSAEEAFNYSDPRYRTATSNKSHPVMNDSYNGELQLTGVELPPSPPEWKDDTIVGIMNTSCPYNVSSTDPENHNISYGWDWDEKYSSLMKAEVDEWTAENHPSNETYTMYHSWNEPGIYQTMVKSKDEYGAAGIFRKDCWSTQGTTIAIVEDEIVDQFQTDDRVNDVHDLEELNFTIWHAQSFKPNISELSKIALKLKQSGDVKFDVFIRDNLTGSNIVEISYDEYEGIGNCKWMEFVFPETIQVTPNETYYIVVMCHNNDSWRNRGWASNQYKDGEYPDSYPRGEGWVSYDAGKNWSCPYQNLDHCFVTYKLPDDNNPPDQPIRPSGPLTINVNTLAEYSTNTSDPDGNQVYYFWDWGDGSHEHWDGPYSSGQTVYASHIWTEKGQYSIKVKAKDIYGVESEWSPSLPISVPLNAAFTMSATKYAKVNDMIYVNDTSFGYYEIVNWTWDFGDGNISYEQNTSHQYTTNGIYNVTLTVTDSDSNTDVYYQIIIVDSILPQITNISNSPETVGFGFNVIINADVNDTLSGVDNTTVNITYPDDTLHVFTMENKANNTYEYNFSDTWLVGQYNYTIWIKDNASNSNSSSVHSFNVSAQLNVSVKTLKDDYYHDEYINLTDPPDPTSDIGYELLDDNSVLHIWNTKNDYYFNASSGVQITNHYDEYWSHNVLMLGYHDGDEWKVIYRTDELTGFNKNIDTDNESYINVTLWKDLTYHGYSFRLAIRYHLSVDDSDLTVIPYIKNLGDAIPYVLGFGWEINNIKIANTYMNDWIRVNDTSYLLNQSLDNRYTNLTHTYQIYNETTNETTSYSVPNPRFVLEGRDEGRYFRRTLYLGWDEDLDYLLWVKSRSGQYNAPVSLFIKIGQLPEDAERSTMLHWLDSDEWLGVDGDTLHSFSGEDTAGTLSAALNGTSVWTHSVAPVHWFIIDLEDTYTIKQVRGRSKDFRIPRHAGDPNDVNIYVYDGETAPDWDNTSAWGSKVNPSNITTWVNTNVWQEVDVKDANGRYIKVEVLSTDADYDYIEWGYFRSPMTIFDVYASEIESKIENTGSTDCKGRLLINVEYYDNGTWIVADDTINNATVDTITSGDHMKLDKIFNDIVSTSDLCDISGDISLHRVYVAFRDPDGNVLINDYDIPLNASYEFDVTINPEIDNVSVTTSDPLDTDSSYGWENFTCTVTDNVEVDDVKLVLVGDDTNEYTMTKDGDDYYLNMTISTADEYTWHIWANDTSDNENTSSPQSFDMPMNEDVNMDGCVHFMDLVKVSIMYNDEGADGWVREDVDNGGKVHFMDLIGISLHYNECWRESSSGTPGTGDTNISVLPANQTVSVDETFTVSIYVEPGEAINGVSFDYLYYNVSLVHANSVTEGDLFDPYSTLFSAGTIDNVNGKITDVYGLTLPGTNTVTENGYFCNISFTAQQTVGVSDLDLDGVLVSNVAGNYVDIKVYDGNVTVQQ